MQKYTVICRGMPLEFKGDLLAEGDTHVKHNQERWTHFAIYYTDRDNYILTVTSKFADGGENQRTFICDGFFDVAKNLAHPVYGTISFKGQDVYNQALDYALATGIIDNPRPFLLTEDECGNGKKKYYEDHNNNPPPKPKVVKVYKRDEIEQLQDKSEISEEIDCNFYDDVIDYHNDEETEDFDFSED